MPVKKPTTKKAKTIARKTRGSKTTGSEEFAGYETFLRDVKQRLREGRVRAGLAVNRELVQFYWQLGRDILGRQEKQGWGGKVIDRLSKDLRREFPEMTGLSSRNLQYMCTFARAWGEPEIAPQAVAQIPWGHIRTLLDKVSDPAEREWYVRQTIENGWSRPVLVIHVDRRLYHARGKAQTSFARTLPAPQSDLAQQLVKDPYKFDFLGIGHEAHEREIEGGLVRHIRQFLLELGVGFAFLGNQYRLQVGSEEFFVDLLFYHTKLRCYVVIELKADKFRPEHAGKLNFYCSAIDDLLRHPDDQPTIGLLLCKGHDRLVAEYALRDLRKPIGISEYELSAALPEDLQSSLPTVEQIEAELARDDDAADAEDPSD